MTGQLKHVPPVWTTPPTAPATRVGPPIPDPTSTEGSGVNWQRVRSALRRYWWLIAITTVLGAVLGLYLAKSIEPQYEAFASIWINADSPENRSNGPIRGEGLLTSSSWPELLTSYSILDSVAYKMRLYVRPADDAPPRMFSQFDIAESFAPGVYELRMDDTGRQYQLLDARGVVLEHGAPGDSIGRTRGFRWAPPAASFENQKSISFKVTTVREAAVGLRKRMSLNASRESSILPVMLTGRDAEETAAALRAIVNEFEATAARLKTRNLVEFTKALEEQLSYAAVQLHEAEVALETFRVRTITLPSEGGSVVAGLEITRDPVLHHFFDQRLQLDSIHNDRVELSGVLDAMKQRKLTPQTLLSIPSVNSATELTAAINELTNKEASLRTAREAYTDQSQKVIDLRDGINRLQTEVIPAMAANLAARLSRQETDLGARVDGASRELRQIPTRTIEEMRLRRNVDVRLALYTTLKSRYEEARLAQASSLPDMSVLDYPVVPPRPTRSERVRVAGLALLFGIAAGLALALGLDYQDRRFRYPEQATHELGLEIVGAVPRVRVRASAKARAEQTWQLTEAFRTLRLSIAQMKGDEALALAVTSPGSGDGKSFVSSNLALSCVSAGYRTVLVDADIHRGALHKVFDVSARPGLTDYLAGSVDLQTVMRPTSSGVTFISAGTRGDETAELLASPRMNEAMATLHREFDVVVVDSPPLCAGIDAFVLATQARNMLLVLRTGQTDRKLADAKLRLADRLPIRVLGAVLNGVPAEGSYRYYGYHYAGVNHTVRGPGAGRTTALTPS